jgi:hypothetical protein
MQKRTNISRIASWFGNIVRLEETPASRYGVIGVAAFLTSGKRSLLRHMVV